MESVAPSFIGGDNGDQRRRRQYLPAGRNADATFFLNCQKKEEGSYGIFRYAYRGNIGKKRKDVP
jgi:hypothetical protein